MIDQSTDKADDQVDPVTVLPLARPSGQESTLLTVPDSDQQTDHSHRPVPPVAAGGIPYRYKVRLARRNVYASTADEVLSLFIEDYRPRPEPTADIELEQVKLRGEHCIGVIVNHVAQAMIAGELSSGDEAVLQRSAEYSTGRDPITAGELPRWDHPKRPHAVDGGPLRTRMGPVRSAAGQRPTDLARPRRALPQRSRRPRVDRAVGEPERQCPALDRTQGRSDVNSSGRQQLSNDQMALMILGAVALSVVIARHKYTDGRSR